MKAMDKCAIASLIHSLEKSFIHGQKLLLNFFKGLPSKWTIFLFLNKPMHFGTVPVYYQQFWCLDTFSYFPHDNSLPLTPLARGLGIYIIQPQ